MISEADYPRRNDDRFLTAYLCLSDSFGYHDGRRLARVVRWAGKLGLHLNAMTWRAWQPKGIAAIADVGSESLLAGTGMENSCQA